MRLRGVSMFGTGPFVPCRERLTRGVLIRARDVLRDGEYVLFAARPLGSARGDRRGVERHVGSVPVRAYLRSLASQADGEDNALRRHYKRDHPATFQPLCAGICTHTTVAGRLFFTGIRQWIVLS